MKYLLALVSSVCLWSTSSALKAVQDVRQKYNFNPDWRVFVGDATGAEKPEFNDNSWLNVTTPYAWNENDAFRLDIANLSTGIAWYRKHFKVPTSAAGQKLFLEFEGIRFGGEFYLNGKSIGLSENGVMAFGFDITNGVLPNGTNVVAARIDNAWDYKERATGQIYQWNDKNFYANYGGINKNVYLHVTGKLYQTLPLYSNLQTTGVYINAQNIDVAAKSAKITAESQVRNEYNTSQKFSFQVTVSDMDGKLVKEITGADYTLQPNQTQVISASDTISGLNLWSWGYGYLYTVRTVLKVNGAAVDTVTTKTGFRKTNFANGMFKLNDRTLHLKGYAQRTTNEWVALGSAVPAWLSDFSNNLVLQSHGSLIRWMHVTPWKQDVESLDRLGLMQALPPGDSESDPTGRRWDQRLELMRDAVIYNRNNPSVIFYETGNKGVTEDHQSQMKALRDKYDPHGGRASGSREMLNSTVAEYGGEMLYINKGARIPFYQHEYSRDEGLRKYWDDYSPPYHHDGDGPPYKDEDASVYNRNQDSHAVENVVRWFDYYEQRPGTGKRVNAGGVNIIFSDSNTHHRGEENYRRSGEVDAVRLPKDGWYAHQVMWNTWVDIEKPAIHLVGHWNYNTSTVKNVYVVANTDRVELQLNGKSLGFGVKSKQFLFNFTRIAYAPGDLKAIGYTSTNQTVSDTKSTSGDPASIKLTPLISPAGLRATGSDIALVEVEVVDAQGKRCPTALNTISFTLSGEASWRGGIAQGPDNYILAKTLPVENGVNRVLLRTTTKAGSITLSATSSGLQSASVSLTSKEFSKLDGLSLEHPADGLPSYLGRGPTPSGDSYTMKRTPLTVSSVTAGSNGATALLSYDDNEYSSWSSSSNAGEAWIKYGLASSSKINQVVLKLPDFRTKSYPLKISVDDKVVWTGFTPTNLGYATLEFTPTAGSSVTLTLDKTGTLGVTEAEIYAPL